jgi:hypothetical protein
MKPVIPTYVVIILIVVWSIAVITWVLKLREVLNQAKRRRKIRARKVL